MKKTVIALSSAALLFFAACGDSSSSDEGTREGDDQIQDPVLNSGADAERRRATDAVSDSANVSDTNNVIGDPRAPSAPH